MILVPRVLESPALLQRMSRGRPVSSQRFARALSISLSDVFFLGGGEYESSGDDELNR